MGLSDLPKTNSGLYLPPNGYDNWDEPINENFKAISTAMDNIANGNIAINGSIRVWQRGMSFNIQPGKMSYTSDRVQIVNETDNIINAMRENAGTKDDCILINAFGNGTAIIGYNMEPLDFDELIGRTITVSVDFSVTRPSRAVSAIFLATTSNPRGNGNGHQTFAGRQTMSYTVDVVDRLGEFVGFHIIRLLMDGQPVDIRLYSFKIEIGDHATPFVPRPYAEELALCQRYYEKSYNVDIPPGTGSGSGFFNVHAGGIETLALSGPVFKVSKRIIPSVNIYSLAGIPGRANNTDTGAEIYTVTDVRYVGENQISSVWVDLPIPPGGGIEYHWVADAEIY